MQFTTSDNHSTVRNSLGRWKGREKRCGIPGTICVCVCVCVCGVGGKEGGGRKGWEKEFGKLRARYRISLRFS